MRVVIEHPQGHGLGNAGVVAKRTGVEIKAGESTYTELGVDAGVAGVLAFVLWSIAILVGLWRREAWLFAAFATVLVLGLQTDVIGIHWLAFTVWAAAGLALGLPRAARQERDAPPGMLGCGGGVGIDVYDGGRRRLIVRSNITRTGRVSSAATDGSPADDARAHVGVWRPRGSARAARLAVKQLPFPEPCASARSARPLPVTTFREMRLPRGRHGGPGSGTPG